MADVEGLDDDRDTALPPSALSPAEYRSFRPLVTELLGVNNQASVYSVVEFLTTFNAVNQGVAQQVVEVVLGPEQGEFVGDGHIYAMIRLVGHWQTDGRIEKSMIFVQARVPERTGSKSSSSSSHEHSTTPSLAPTSTTLNPFRANSSPSSSSSTARTPGTDRGVEAFKRLMFAKSKEGSQSDTTTPTAEPAEMSAQRLPPPAVTLEDSASLYSARTDQSHTGMTFVYTSDEEDDIASSVKHSPETHLRESPQPILPNTTSDRRSLPPLSIPQLSPQKPAPPPSRKRGASGSTQPSTPIDNENKPKLDEKTGAAKRNLPPVPPAPRRTLSSASTPHVRPERSSSIRQPAPPPPTSSDTTKPPPPRPRRKLSDTSVTSFDIQQPRLSSDSQQQPDPPPPTPSTTSVANKRLSAQAPPPPPPPRGRKHDLPPSSPTSRRSTDLPTRLGLERPESPRRASAPDHEKPKILELQDSELSLELGRLQREVDELVYGLTKKRGGTSSGG